MCLFTSRLSWFNFCLFLLCSIEDVISGRGDYLGCFQDQDENRLLSEVRESLYRLTTVQCVDLCHEGGYPFAGTQSSSECYCGYNKPPLIARRPDSECSMPCSGDDNLKCGGEFRLSAYDTGISAIGSVPSGFHVGCFRQSSGQDGQKLLSGLHQEFSSLTPKICSEFCFKKGFKLSGLQNGKDCYCTNKKLDTSKKLSHGDECNIICAGDSSRKCGGAEHLNVYATGLTDIPATGRHVACYRDQPDENGHHVRLLPDFRSELRKTLSPGICMNMCYQMGYNFAGLISGYECFCGAWLPAIDKSRPDNECNMICEGSPGEICGGLWRLNVYRTPLAEPQRETEAAEHLGCYYDQKENRLLSEVRESSAELTPSICTERCAKGGYAFAGVHGSSECFCGHSRPPLLAKRLESECASPCSGDHKLNCGGVDGISVYKTGLTAIGALPSQFYLGCFAENTGQDVQRLLPDVLEEFNGLLTPKLCSEFCLKKGFKLAGLQGKNCFCTNKGLDMKKKLNDGECKTACEGDSSKTCGGPQQLNVYATGLTDYPATGRNIACYKDQPNESGQILRLLPEFRTELHGILSPRVCMNICYQMGFRFSGLEAGFECYCGVWQPDQNKSRTDLECRLDCEGSPGEVCGGHWRLQVYKTPLLEDAGKEAVELIGCYADQEEYRLLGDVIEGNTGITIPKCTDLCSKKGFPFAGVQRGTQCFCGYNRPAQVAKRPDSECSKPCSENQESECYRMSVYKTGKSSIGAVPSGSYVGCFTENTEEKVDKSQRLFPDLQQTFKELTPKLCIEFCFKGGYKMAAVHKNYCFCTSKKLDMKRKVASTECSAPCSADSSKKCGATGRVNVYATGLTDSPITGRAVGCYEDIPDESGKLVRAMPDFRTELRQTNTPQTCMNLCYQMGFRFAGLQAGAECFCGRWLPAKEKSKPDHHCNTDCTGDPNQKCGGHWRLQVYKTPLADRIGGSDELIPSSSSTNQPPRPTPRPPPPTSTTPTDITCQLSTTVVNGKRACRNSVIFFDDFNELNPSRWSHEIKIASKPDYEFTVFDAKPENTFIRDGALHIQPTVFDESFVKTGSLQLESCTGEAVNEECSRTASHFILPPTQSSRITTRQKFNFKYGVVEIQAKLPLGDWIVSEMWLMPADSNYGAYYESGKIKMTSRGNYNLKYPNGRDMGSQTVEGSVMLGYGTNVKSKSVYFTKHSGWHSGFHNFTIIWTPDDIAFSVDGKRKQNIMVNSQGSKISDVIGLSSSEIKIWNSGTTLAPFDQPFYISLGLSVGGLKDFQDQAESSGYAKPWNNTDPRASLKFWNSRNQWEPSWQGEDTAFVIKSIKVTSL